MTATATHRAARIVLALGVLAFIGVRLATLDDDFPNPDIAGIVYNAELLLDGRLPYVDSVEIKPPGTFVLAALSFVAFGRDLLGLQLGHALWLLAGAPAVWLATRECLRDAEAPVRALAPATATAVYLLYAPMFSYNYSSWMMPAYAIAVAAAARGFRDEHRGWLALAGAAAVLGTATIQRGGLVAVVLLAQWRWARASGRAWLWPAAGGAAMLVLLSLPWLLTARFDAFAGGLVPLDAATRYRGAADGSLGATAIGAASQLVREFWFPCSLAVVALVVARLARMSEGEEPAPARAVVRLGAVWLAASMAGAALGGGRFYLHYLVQYVPALALLAAHPGLLAVLRRTTQPPVLRRLAALAVGLLVVVQLVELGAGRGVRYEAKARRLEDGRTASQAAGLHIRQRTREDETVMAWGWTAWRIYFWSQRRAPTAIYKPLGTLTTFNTNTAFEVGSSISLRPGPWADMVVEAFDEAPPTYFVYSPSYEETFGASPDPLAAWTPMLERLRTRYALEAVYGDLRLFRLLPEGAPPAAAGGADPTAPQTDS